MRTLSTSQKRPVLVVIDAGGNSISAEFRFADNPHFRKSPELPSKLKAICGLAAGLGPEHDGAKQKALKIMREIADNISSLREKGYPLTVRAIGTAPFRISQHGPEFSERIQRETGIEIETIDGDQEARYAAVGVLSYYPNISGVVTNTGGGSTEFARLQNGEIIETFSIPLGMLGIAAAQDPKTFIKQHLETLPSSFHGAGPLIITGGANRVMIKAFANNACIDISETPPPNIVRTQDFTAFAHELAEADEDKLRRKFSIEAERAHQMKPASFLLDMMCEKLGVTHIALNKATLRDGVRAEMLKALRESTTPTYAHRLIDAPGVFAALG
jgi:exopolyphosphatase/guanosine-5'-triphosphate,3'-diphosphate pyrophosphatase